MDNPLVVSLIVTGIGMTVLFLALALLYALMVLMTEVIRERKGREGREGKEGREGREGGEEGARWRAAVIGVALARAEHELAATGLPAPAGMPSAWRVLHQQRQLTLSLRPRRTR